MNVMVTCSEREGTVKPMARSIDVINEWDKAKQGSDALLKALLRFAVRRAA